MQFIKSSTIHSSLKVILATVFLCSLLFSFNAPANAQNTDSKVKYTSKEQYDEDFPPPPIESLNHNGISREYIVYLPKNYDRNSKVPLLLNFHGFGGMARYHYYTADMRAVADSENFILVYPQGTLLNGLEGQAHWNAALDTPENKSDADDFGFIEALIEKLSSNYLIDRERIYAMGYSNGGYFSYALACYLSENIAAIASISGTMLLETHSACNPQHQIGMLNIHGTADAVVPYYYDATDNLASIEAVLSYWAEFNAGQYNPVINVIQTSSTVNSENLIEHFTYVHSNNDIYIEHYKIVDGEHIWFDFTYNGVSTNQVIWNFLSRYSTNGLIW